MNLQVLVSTMNQKDNTLFEKMNIQSDAIFVNQCDKNKFEEANFKGHNIRFLSLAERGIGLSRNTALMRATSDICLFADDDVTYVEGYKKIILNEFKKNPKADIIIFNMLSTHSERGNRIITKNRRLYFNNCFRFGTYQVAIRLESIKKANIHFSLLFGGGARYSCGEDSLFLGSALRGGLKIYSSTQVIGKVSHQQSTWFNGYTDKYFIDKGVLYYCLSKGWAKMLCIQFVLRHGDIFKQDKTRVEALRLMIRGIEEIKI